MADINLKNVPDDLRDKYKAYCALKRTTMREDLMRYMKEVVEKAGIGKS